MSLYHLSHLLFCQETPREPAVPLIHQWQRDCLDTWDLLSAGKHFIAEVSGWCQLHCTKLDCRNSLARTQMLVPKPLVNWMPLLCFQQAALWCDHWTSSNIPRSEKQIGGIHWEPETGHRQSPQLYHFFPWSPAVSCTRNDLNFLPCKFLQHDGT